MMALELAEAIEINNQSGLMTRAIVPCGPKCWYGPFVTLVNARSFPFGSWKYFTWMSALTGKVGCLLSIIRTTSALFYGKAFLQRNPRDWQFHKNSGTGLRQQPWER